jgi:hypothetical protein
MNKIQKLIKNSKLIFFEFLQNSKAKHKILKLKLFKKINKIKIVKQNNKENRKRKKKKMLTWAGSVGEARGRDRFRCRNEQELGIP